MPELTLERIADLRKRRQAVIADECWRTWGGELRQGPVDNAEHSASRLIASFELQPNRSGKGSHVAPLYLVQEVIAALPALLDAAERGLTGMAWTVNGPDVKKPKGWCLVAVAGGVRYVKRFRDGWWEGQPSFGSRHCEFDKDVTHFMPIKEPTDA